MLIRASIQEESEWLSVRVCIERVSALDLCCKDAVSIQMAQAMVAVIIYRNCVAVQLRVSEIGVVGRGGAFKLAGVVVSMAPGVIVSCGVA